MHCIPTAYIQDMRIFSTKMENALKSNSSLVVPSSSSKISIIVGSLTIPGSLMSMAKYSRLHYDEI